MYGAGAGAPRGGSVKRLLNGDFDRDGAMPVCPSGGLLGVGDTLGIDTLSIGTHVITASVTDSEPGGGAAAPQAEATAVDAPAPGAELEPPVAMPAELPPVAGEHLLHDGRVAEADHHGFVARLHLVDHLERLALGLVQPHRALLAQPQSPLVRFEDHRLPVMDRGNIPARLGRDDGTAFDLAAVGALGEPVAVFE